MFMVECPMERDQILATLKAHEAALKARGVTHAAIFGSRARGDHRPDSDIDVVIDLDPNAPIGVYEYVGITNFISDLFDRPVDVVERKGLKPRIRPAVTSDAVYAF